MKQEFKFKTNIHCGGCIARVTPFMNKIEGVVKWDVDIDNPEKILTVESSGVTPQQIIETVEKLGFDIELKD